MYAEGQGVPQDYIESYKWFDLAANAGLASAVEWREYVAASMTLIQKTKAKWRVRQWQLKEKP